MGTNRERCCPKRSFVCRRVLARQCVHLSWMVPMFCHAQRDSSFSLQQCCSMPTGCRWRHTNNCNAKRKDADVLYACALSRHIRRSRVDVGRRRARGDRVQGVIQPAVSGRTVLGRKRQDVVRVPSVVSGLLERVGST